MVATFTPPRPLQNPHVQTILASLAPRKVAATIRASKLRKDSKEYILNCGNGIRLLGAISRNQKNSKGLVTLIHGWEGSIDSAYLLSAAGVLYEQGFNVFRLNLRDHGKSHHLNKALFNSTRLDEVVQAVAEIQRLFPHDHHFLTGFSLGGNFALRVGLRAASAALHLTKIATVSPLIDPVAATINLEEKHPVYHRYFVRKWKQSLRIKIQLYPDIDDQQTLLRLHSLTQMHDYFVPRHTDHPTTHAYLSAYKLSRQQLASLEIPTHIICSTDDPITAMPGGDLSTLSPIVDIEQVNFGGHCGFLQDFRLTSWADQRLVEIFQAATI
ncbi:YheT family hydrolase [Desulfogranum marinum]|uniref:YheT family hydrolase n=1 Tax=Desulfogranum marinum TaxID=453220 RepID=UPI0019669B4A|nr:alpha/beta fold hydrolase [Desulfogranum marinum]MBM9514314.1 alpha/beta fold hydrolase [Desulfogranum marinum]